MVIPCNIIAINSTINIIVTFNIITDLYIFYPRIYYFLKGLSQASFHVIYQKRVRVFHQGFQTPRNRWKHEAAGRVPLLFRGVWNPWWNTKHEFLV